MYDDTGADKDRAEIDEGEDVNGTDVHEERNECDDNADDGVFDDCFHGGHLCASDYRYSGIQSLCASKRSSHMATMSSMDSSEEVWGSSMAAW